MKDAVVVAVIGAMSLIIAGLLAAVLTLSLRIGELPTRAETDRKFGELSDDIRAGNEQLLRALADHTHTEDGDAIFTVPPGAGAAPADTDTDTDALPTGAGPSCPEPSFGTALPLAAPAAWLILLLASE